MARPEKRPQQIELRPYQEEAVLRVLEDWKRAQRGDGGRSVLISIPTGGGKTHIIGAILSRVLTPEAGKPYPRDRALVLVHTEELLQQAVEKISAHLPSEVSVTTVSSSSADFSGDVVIGMVGTISSRASMLEVSSEKYGVFRWVITDEADRKSVV